MLLKLEDPRLFSDVISIISELVQEVKINVTRNGFEIVAIDPANVALLMLKIPVQSFSQYQIENDEQLAVNLNDLKNILRRCGSGSSLIMEKSENTLKIDVQDKVKRSFILSLIDIDSEDRNVPSLEFASSIELSSLMFSEAVEDAAVVADACSFVTTGNKFRVEAKGSLNSSLSEFSGDEAKLNIKDAKSKYSLEYLQKFIKAAKLSDSVIIRFSQNYPLRVDFRNDMLELGFILAPRVESEE